MSTIRFNALKETLNRVPLKITEEERKSEAFDKNVFNEHSMRQLMTKEAFQSVMDAIEFGKKIDRNVADQVAAAMKDWALSKNATHYTHWFQPLTGATAEKHDAFFETIGNGRAMEKFGGGELVQQEPDASSFPNGGIRNTFEARGYTAWDPTSPAFIYGTTLCIPTIFVAYTGEALDNKAPLLRALQAIDNSATAVCKYFDKNVTKVNASLGWEQEYFLIDSALAISRPDINLTGRTLLGHSPAKGQQLDDHYFGSIPRRVLSYMRDMEQECMLLGIPVKTRHNEVAPNQYELAPIFEEANLAVDHNSLLMDVMERVAQKHNFRVLFHEKPFAGINGSGKHNNWSLATSTGVNLLSPGKTPMKNLQFLTFFVNTIKAVHDYEELIRASIASASNDHRLGANEAPPAIISVFIGSQLSAVLDELENVTKGKLSPEEKTDLKLNIVGKIPEILLDNTDRNRTSPFAFTGNRFEFRAVGSSQSVSGPLVAMNTMLADSLNWIAEKLEATLANGTDKTAAVIIVLKELMEKHGNVIFGGDGYSSEWHTAADEKHGIKNIPTKADTLPAIKEASIIKLFESTGLFSPVETDNRVEVYAEQYILSIEVEAKLVIDIATTKLYPAAINYLSTLTSTASSLSGMGIELENSGIADVAAEASGMMTAVNKLSAALAEHDFDSVDEHMKYCADVLCVLMLAVRAHADTLEGLVADELWPLPKYQEMLFIK